MRYMKSEDIFKKIKVVEKIREAKSKIEKSKKKETRKANPIFSKK